MRKLIVLTFLTAAYTFGSWSYSRPLRIDHTLVGGADANDFPTLVKISDATFKTAASGGHIRNTNGYDIAFYADSGLQTPLFWEIDSYDGVNGVLWAWVKVPTVSHTADTTIYVAYGDAGISTFQSTASSVWTAGYGFVAHLGNGTTPSGTESTAHGFTLSTAVSGVPGKIGGAAGFDGSTQFMSTHNASSAAYPWAFEAWGKLSSTAIKEQVLMAQSNGSNISWMEYFPQGPSLAIRAVTCTAGCAGVSFRIFNFPFDTNWHHIVVVFQDSSHFATYVDGAPTAILDGYSNGPAPTSTFTDTILGNTDPSPGGFSGVIDESRVYTIQPSAEWILTEYNNQNSPSTFIAVGAEAALGGDGGGGGPVTSIRHRVTQDD